ncbi:hypothetical protein [Vibrio sp. YIC-376]|uniref:hypothetical protein n=1 Tax=Vibrio sp. YIC-376 TaxID=3136162 RepID=UPI00402A9150
MKENIYRTSLFKRVTRALTIVLGCIIWICALPAYAVDGAGTVVSNGCMQDIAGFDLGCTANDVRVSGVADVTGDGIVDEDDITFAPICDAIALNAGADCSSDPNICLDSDGVAAPEMCGDRCSYPGDTTQFSATFIFELSAQARYDVGAYFEVEPDTAEDGALTGACQIVTLPEDGTGFTRPDGTTGNFVDLDSTCKGGGCPQPTDLCGDIDDDNNPIYYDMKGAKATADYITATCIDPDGDGKLNLPNCTSWRQSGANDLCYDGTDAFPGSPSKCNCDPNFQVPITVPPATITVEKTANPTSAPEDISGLPVQYTVDITNNSIFAVVTIDTLVDDIFGDITSSGHDGITSTTCSVPFDIAAGATETCTFNATITAQGGTEHTNTVTASGYDENENPMSDDDDATVIITNVPFEFSVTKTANPTALDEPGGQFTFDVVVTNDSSADAIEVTVLDDDIYGDITSTLGDIISTDCSTPQTIAIGGNYSCSFTVEELHQPPWSQTDTVTATASDEEGPEDTRSDTATININDVDSSISVDKTANPTSFDEPSEDVTYTIVVTNTSTKDTVDINSLDDTILNDVTTTGHDGITSTTCSVPQTLLVGDGSSATTADGDTYSCEVTVSETGNADDTITNVVTASGLDDDGEPVTSNDDATVTVNDVQPTATLDKSVTSMDVLYTVVVTNTSVAEDLDLTDLTDNLFGDITSVQGNVLETECNVPQTIAIGDDYTCTFVGRVYGPHTNTVTGTVSDDDGNTINPSDTATVSFSAD